jgi:hypothetical protein
MKAFNIVVVGGGASGLMAAIRAGQIIDKVLILEKNNSLGRKLSISGKGRCNLTNIAELEDFLTHFSRNGNFLRSAFGNFFNKELIDFFRDKGLALKVERGKRVFPEDDLSDSVLNILKNCIKQEGVQVVYKARVSEIRQRDSEIKEISLENNQRFMAKKVILATGGLSYPLTGSTGDGYAIANNLGHCIISIRPGLVPLVIKERWVKDLMGLGLKNVRIKILCRNKAFKSDVGEMIFTHFGVSGPLVLGLSNKVVDLLKEKEPVKLSIDLKPGLTDAQLDNRILRDIENKGSLFYKNLLKDLLPRKLIKVFIYLSGISPDKKANQITQKERFKMRRLFKDFRLTIVRPRPIKEAIITRGGVSTRQINPKTMESNLIEGLYFCGEIIDVDADTGGYNLQAAFSTGYLAGQSAARSLIR